MTERKAIATNISYNERYLMVHWGSDSVFEVLTRRSKSQALSDGCDDVTGVEAYEKWFKTGKMPKELVEMQKGTPTLAETLPLIDFKKLLVENDLPLDQKYRPVILDEVVGQPETVKSLKKALDSKTRPHAFLFEGPSGCGKTTLARIVANVMQCSPENIIEADGATATGIDAVRELTSGLRYQGFGETPNKMYLIDECHMLSKNAWAALLKAVEEPPEHVYFAFCTTEGSKVPEAIKTRCLAYSLKKVKYDALMDLLEMVVLKEKMDPIDKLLGMIARAADGSPRQALKLLAKTIFCDDVEEAEKLLEGSLENKEIIDLCRLVIKGDLTWEKLTSTLKAMPEVNAEGIRIVIVNYINTCLMGARNRNDTEFLLDMQTQFVKPFNPVDKLAPILLAFGNIIYPS